MPVRVELIDEAVDDLARQVESGNLPAFLKKLIRLEEVGEDAGLPLGGGLAGWRKIVVGDRNWRIIFTMSSDGTTATIRVIGDRADAECFPEAMRRVEALGRSRPEAASLAAVMFELSSRRVAGRQPRRRDR